MSAAASENRLDVLGECLASLLTECGVITMGDDESLRRDTNRAIERIRDARREIEELRSAIRKVQASGL